MNRSDSGYILPATIVTLTLLAFAALLTGRTFGVLLRASVQERLILEERFAARNAEKIVDAWMADPALSKEITEPAPRTTDPNGFDYDAWRNPEGAANTQTTTNCPTAGYSTCWRITATDPHADPTKRPKLRGGEAVQELRDITIEVKSGCYAGIDRCQRTNTITRTYERNVFSQYQLHYESHLIVPAAANGLDGREDPSGCFASPPPESPPDPALCDGLDPTSLVVFADGDVFNGPVRYSGSGPIQYCLTAGSLEFKRVETKDEVPEPPPPHTDPQCNPTLLPSWCTNNDCSKPDPWNQGRSTRLEDGKGDILELPKWGGDSPPAATVVSCSDSNLRCTKTDFDYPDKDVFYSTDDIYLSDIVFGSSVTPEDGKSISIVSRGSIYINGDIETYGTNKAGGPNVVALIAKNDIVLDHAHTNGLVQFKNVAVLALEGGIYAKEFETACVIPCPKFTLEGSIASKHLGLYGKVDPPAGWIKSFTYPENFWRARPPWWPKFSPKEWRLVH